MHHRSLQTKRAANFTSVVFRSKFNFDMLWKSFAREKWITCQAGLVNLQPRSLKMHGLDSKLPSLPTVESSKGNLKPLLEWTARDEEHRKERTLWVSPVVRDCCFPRKKWLFLSSINYGIIFDHTLTSARSPCTRYILVLSQGEKSLPEIDWANLGIATTWSYYGHTGSGKPGHTHEIRTHAWYSFYTKPKFLRLSQVTRTDVDFDDGLKNG